MQSKFLKVGSLALLQIVILGNIQIVPANAIYGLSLPFLFTLAILCFYLPCVLMVAELATTHPQTGGAYIWCEQAFGSKAGFFTVSLLWLSNLLWYPSVFSLIAANFAYLFNPALAQNKTFVMLFGLILFWIFTALNCMGIRFSSRVSIWCSVLGIIMPLFLIGCCGFFWWLEGQPLAVSTLKTPLVPNLFHLDNLGYLISIVMTLFGIEVTAVHAGNVVNPKRDYPSSLLISSIITLSLLFLAALSIAIVIPSEKLNLITGLLDTLVIFFQQAGLSKILTFILLLVFIGNVGSVAAWMLGSTRGVYVAAQHNHVAPFLQKTNKFESPIGVLLFEAIVYTAVSGVFLLFSQVASTFWLLMVLASQLTLIYYFILFLSAIRLRYLPVEAPGFLIPGGKWAIWALMGLGACTSLISFCIGFIAPSNLNNQEVFLFHLVMSAGLIISISLPFLFFIFKDKSRSSLK